MNKHKLQAIALLSAVLCFFVISVSLSRSTYAYVFGQSHICRSDFYTEKTESSVPESSVPESSVPESSVPESSVPESSVPESSSEKPPTGDRTDTLPLAAVSAVSMMAAAIWMSFRRSRRNKDTND